jgi:hypothetical protein
MASTSQQRCSCSAHLSCVRFAVLLLRMLAARGEVVSVEGSGTIHAESVPHVVLHVQVSIQNMP